MNPEPASRSRVTAKVLVSLAALLVMSVGGLVLLGWLFNVSIFKSLHPDWVSMKANTALCFLLSGLALWLLTRPGLATPAGDHQSASAMLRRRGGQVCAGLVMLIAALTLTEYFFGWELRVDQMLFRETAGAIGTAAPNRMALTAAVNFILVGLTLFQIGWRRSPALIYFAVSGIVLISLLGLTGYFGEAAVHFFVAGTRMALHTSLGFLILALGLGAADAHVNDPLPGVGRVLPMGFGALLALFVVGAGIGFQNTKQLQTVGDWHAHTHQVKELIEDLHSAMSDAETGMRGFLLTGEDAYLEPYSAALARIPENFHELRTLTADNAAQQARLTDLDVLIHASLQSSGRLIQLVREQGREPARQMVLTGQGKRDMDAIRRLVNDLKAEEDRLLTLRQASWQTRNSAFRRVLGLLAGLVVVVLVGGYHLLNTTARIRQRAQQALGESEAMLNETGRMAKVGGWVIDLEKGTLKWTREVYAIHEVAEDFQPTVETAINFYAPEWQPVIRQAVERGMQSGAPWLLELELITARGRRIWVRATGAVASENGKAKTLSGSFQDITVRKQSELALQESEERFRLAAETANDVVYDWDLKQSVQWFGKIDELLGYGPGEFPRTLDAWAAVVHPEDLERTMAAIQAHLEGRGPYSAEYRVRRKDGVHRWWVARGAVARTPRGEPVRMVGSITDFTERKLAEVALRASEEEHRLLIQHLHAGVVVHAPDTRILLANTQASVLLGLSADEMSGKQAMDPAWSFVHGDGTPMPLAEYPVNRARSTGEPLRNLEVGVNRPRVGDRVWLLVNAFPEFDPQGKLRQVVVTFVDITARRQAEAELRQLAAIVESSEDAMIGLDLNGRITSWNQGATKLYGYAPGEMIGTSILRLIPGDRQAEEREILERIRRGESVDHIETVRLTQDGRSVEVSITASPIKSASGKLVGVSKVARDITDRKAAEEKLKSTLAELGRSNQELEQFAYIASHDLQEPLRMVSSYTQLLGQRFEGQLDDRGKKYIRYVVEGALRMQALINDLLAFSRVGMRGGPLENTSSLAALQVAQSNLSVAMKEKQARLSHDELPLVAADPSQLVLLFQNLIGNAIKFHREAPPHVHVSARDQGREWVFALKDNGIGIEPQHAERVFVIFQRLHTREEYPGTGIGLAVCKRIVERHGGRIWFESEPGKGTTFFFTIPKQSTTAGTKPAQPSPKL